MRTSTTAPGAPAGVTQVRCASSSTLTCAALALPKVTVAGPAPEDRKPVPVSCTGVPPADGPSAGEIALRVGAVESYEKAPIRLPAPLAFWTVTETTASGAAGGVTHVRCESSLTATCIAAAEPKSTCTGP